MNTDVLPTVKMSPPTHAREAWRRYLKGRGERPSESMMRVGIAATFTVDSLVPMVGAALLASSFTPDILSADYNQLFQVCLNPTAHFRGDLDAIILLWRIEELMPEEFDRFIRCDSTGLASANLRIDELAEAVATLRGTFDRTIIISLPPFPDVSTAHLMDLDSSTNAGRFHRVITEHAAATFTAPLLNLRLLDLDALQRSHGAKAAFDARKWHLYRQPYTEAFLFEIGVQAGRIISATKKAPKKCVVLDCDNTLWGGIVGEDGAQGLALGQDFPGSAFRDLQKFLLYLHSRGVMLALVSKNNEADVWEVFDKHDGMLLKREHISAWRINWERKSENIRSIADELNIGTDSLVFVDDNAFEIEEALAGVAGLTTVHISDEPSRMVEGVRSKHLFDKIDFTKEDSKRTAMMHSEKRRISQAAGVSKEAFVASLGLSITFGEATKSHLGRVAQLINKTNQFNLTTVRRTLEEVTTLFGDASWKIFVISVEDKFGDYGLVGVAIVETAPTRWRLDTLLMSCRVLGRGVETAYLAAIGRYARAVGVEMLEAAFIPTSKNSPAADVLSNHGFVRLDEHRFEIGVRNLPPVPEYIAVEFM